MQQTGKALAQGFCLFGCCEARAFLRGYGGTGYSLAVFGMVCFKQWLMEWLIAGEMYSFLLLVAALPAGINAVRALLSPHYNSLRSPWHAGGKYMHYLTLGLLKDKHLLVVEVAAVFCLALQCVTDTQFGRFIAWWQYFHQGGERLLPDLAAAPDWLRQHYGDIARFMPMWTFSCLLALNKIEWREANGSVRVRRPPETRQELAFHRVEMTK